VQVWSNQPFLQTEHSLDQTSNASSGLKVSDVRLHRTQQAGSLLAPLFHQDRLECIYLNRIAKRGTRTMRLDVADFSGTYTCIL
jgi:hypothetical protein